MKVSGLKAFLGQPLGNLLGFFPGVAVDNTRFIWILLLDKLEDRGFYIFLLRYDLVPQIGAVKGLGEKYIVGQTEGGNHVL